MKMFLLTMQFNETLLMPVFLRHYARYFKNDEIFVIDHGSSQNLVPIGCNRIFLPRDRPFSEQSRSILIRSIAAGLLEYFDGGIYVDCDELIDLGNLAGTDLKATPVTYLAGFDVYWSDTPAGRRLYGLLNPWLCKPLIFTRAPAWIMGFHSCEDTPQLLTRPMAHVRYLFLEQSAQRLRERAGIQAAMRPDEKARGIDSHWATGDLHLNDFYAETERRKVLQIPVEVFSPIDPRAVFELRVPPNNKDPNIRGVFVPKGRWEVSQARYDLSERFPHLLD